MNGLAPVDQDTMDRVLFDFHDAVSLLRQVRPYLPDRLELSAEIDGALPTFCDSLRALARCRS
jgi:hypothetical protein